MRILGISAFYHDSAAALIQDGQIVAAAQEERFTRRKHDPDFPANAVRYCLAEAGCTMDDIDHVAFYDKPFLKFERLLETYLATVPGGFRSFRAAIPVWVKEKLFQKSGLRRRLGEIAGRKRWDGSLLFSEHHVAHAASAFFASPYKSAAVLTMDGVGEWCTTSLGHGHGKRLDLLKEIHFPHSLGLLYSAFTYYTGFKVNSGEYKIMGLAPYGRPRYAQTILDHLIDLKEDGSFWLDQRYFDYCTGLTMTSPAFNELFGGEPRKPESPMTQREMDLAASIQAVTEEAVLRLARFARRETAERQLCLAGGVALNCVANGKVLKEGVFDDVWIQPAAGDAGGAVGAALAVWHQYLDSERTPNGGDLMEGAYLGPAYSQAEIEQRLTAAGAVYGVMPDSELIATTVDALTEEKAVGWMQGRMEFGPRALGNRSILGDPRSPRMQKTLNLKVKYRESFRPFAPSVRREDVSEWFEMSADSPYMLLVADVCDEKRVRPNLDEEELFGIERLNVPRSDIPAVTHVDYSARVQTVHRETNQRYWDLLTAFKERTGCPVLVNTSFNVRGEPIVCSPEDAYRCFMGTDIERLVIGNAILRKEDQPVALRKDYKEEFELD
ncbi:carbamoyltransferase [Nitratireductor sp. GCM10026969]|uniref:carbamoyltransferase family protein n=1 Tax=Nitratireductor sp. GCM10026969 TaxID=3252645 RepID=UPI00361633A5